MENDEYQNAKLLGASIKKFRGERNLSVRELARRSGISHSYLSQIETAWSPRNKKPIEPTISTLQKVAAGMNITFSEVLEGAGYIEMRTKGMNNMEIKDLNEYQLLALRTKPDLSRKDLMLNAALGSTGEAGELADAIKKHVYHNHPLLFENVGKELGDMMWYIALMAEAFGFTLQEVAEMNIDKLRKRYPDGFSTVDSIKRVDTL